jgi:hypothetical protein
MSSLWQSLLAGGALHLMDGIFACFMQTPCSVVVIIILFSTIHMLQVQRRMAAVHRVRYSIASHAVPSA